MEADWDPAEEFIGWEDSTVCHEDCDFCRYTSDCNYYQRREYTLRMSREEDLFDQEYPPDPDRRAYLENLRLRYIG